MEDRKEPKAMSSRLLTMKFMQRSAVKNSSPTSSTGPSTPTSNGPPSKRQRLSSGSYTPTPSSDYVAVQAALAAEEAKRAQAIERQATEAGETRWVLSFKDAETGSVARGKVQMKVVQAGFAEIDGNGDEQSSDEETGLGAVIGLGGGRMKFGKKKVQVGLSGESNTIDISIAPPTSTEDVSSESEADSDASVSDPDPNADPTDALIRSAQARADRKAKKQAAKAEAIRMAEARRRKEVNLNKGKERKTPSGRGAISMPRTEISGIKCFSCGQEGHLSRNCPKFRNRGKGEKDAWDTSHDLMGLP